MRCAELERFPVLESAGACKRSTVLVLSDEVLGEWCGVIRRLCCSEVYRICRC